MAELDPYRTPLSELQEEIDDPTPSVEEALRRGYDFQIGQLIGDAWQHVSGTKGIFLWGSLVWQLCVAILGALLVAWLAPAPPAELPTTLPMLKVYLAQHAGDSVYHLLANLLCLPFLAGLYMVAVRAAADQSYGFGMLFGYFGKLLPLFVIGLLLLILLSIGFALLIIPGVYLLISYQLAIPLLVERGLSPWQAMEASRKAIGQHWFKVFFLNLLLWLIIAFSFVGLGMALVFLLAGMGGEQGMNWVGLGIGLLIAITPTWTYPLLMLTKGVLYRTIFGVLPVRD